MAVFKTKEDKPVNTIFRLPVDTSTGPNGLLRSEFVKDSNSMLYPLVTESDPEEVQAFLDAGITGPLQARAEGVTAQKRQDIYSEVFEVSALEDKSPEQAITELETLRDDNPFLKAYVSPAVLEALKQSENPTARRVAQGKLANVLIAAEILNNKLSESSSEGFLTNFDFVDTLLSDLPIVSAMNVKRRKELSDRFVQILDSNEDPSVISKELQTIVDEAADMGFFTDSNRFYMNDFLNLTLEQGKGAELALQQGFAGLDALLAAGALADAGKLIGMVRGNVKETSEALMKGVVKDSPAGGVDPATWKESLLTVGRTTPRSPVESAAVKDVEIELQARKEALDIRLAAGSSIDDELFDALQAKMVSEAKKRAAENGNLRYIDSDLIKDEFDNVALTEFYGTTKGRAFTSQKAAQIYADQILGEVVPASGGSGFMVRKATNVPTGIYSQGVTTDNIVETLPLYGPVNPDDLGNSFFSRWGSPQAQSDDTNNAVRLQGEFAGAKARETLFRDVERQLKIVGRAGKNAVEKVFIELRDGSLASLRVSPTVDEFKDHFYTLNGRTATEQEVKLYEQVLAWNDVDWMLSADLHFKRSVERGIEILIPQDGIEVGAVKVTNVESGRLAWDTDTKAYVAVDTLSADRKLYRLVEPMEFDGKLHDLVASATPKTRALRHTDVMGYNAGGARLYEPNRTNFIVKQETEVVLADGTVRKGMPRTLMVTKTEKEALKAETEFNNVIKAIHSENNPKAFHTADEYRRVVATKYKNSELNDLIARNSGWNTDVHSVENLVEWATENNVDLRKTVQFVSDGQPLLKGDNMIGDLTYQEIAVSPGPLKMGDFRKDQVLKGYGGQKVPTIAPFEAINRSLMSSVASQTELAYSTRATMRLFRTAVEGRLNAAGERISYLSADNIALIRNMPIRQKLKNMAIDTGSSDGKKLELERKKIISRLERQRILDDLYHKHREELARVLWDKNWKTASKGVDAMSADPVAGARGITFDAYLSSPDQLYVQGSQIVNIVGMSEGGAGARAVVAAPYFRGIVRNGHKGPTEAMAKLMSKELGIEPEQFLSIIDLYKRTGLHNLDGSLADLGFDSSGAVTFNKARQFLRIPYKEGERIARITAYLTASLEAIAKHGPKTDLSKQAVARGVMVRYDKLTNSMSSTSRHWIEQLPGMQFMGYTMRMAESLLAGTFGGKSVLTGKQKAKLFTLQTAIYGTPAIPVVGYYLDWYNFKNGTDYTVEDAYSIRDGLLDNFIRYATGVESELGRRLAWGEGIFTVIGDLQNKNFFQAATGPAGSLAGNLYDSVSTMIWNMRHANSPLDFAGPDAVNIIRNMKVTNMAYNGYYAILHGLYYSKRGELQDSTMSTAEGVAVLLGVPLEKINESWRNIAFLAKEEQHSKDLGKRITYFMEALNKEWAMNGTGTQQEKIIMDSISNIYAIYPPDVLKSAERHVDKKFLSMNEELFIKLLERQATKGVSE